MLRDYISWIRDTALPFWAEHGFDAEYGRFRERLDGSARPQPVPHRAMVQARQIFVFAHAAEQGWIERGGDMAEHAMTSLLRDFAWTQDEETSFAFSIDPASAAILSPVRDAYAHAFLLFSIAALYRLNRDGRLLELADRIINFVERRLTDPAHGGLFDALPAPPEKRQNPHMHLLEAYLFLERAAPARGYLERAGKLVGLFRRHFLHEGLLLEYFDQDWAVAERAIWEPGHHFEWVWLLGEYSALAGEDMAAEMNALHEVAMRHGLTTEGLVVDELSTAGTVLKPSSRVWPHTEAIKAAATRHVAGDGSARAFADMMAAALMRDFLDRPFAGGWIDHLDPSGAPLVDYVPASTLYHLVLAASVAARDFAAAPALAKTGS